MNGWTAFCEEQEKPPPSGKRRRFANVDEFWYFYKRLEVISFAEQDLIAGLIFLGVAPGGGAGEMSKGADEVGIVRKAGQLARLLYADALLKKLTCLEDAAVDDILHHGKACGRLENTAQVVLADEKLARDLIQGEGIGEVVPDIIEDGGYPQKILVANGLAGGGDAEHGGDFQQKVEQSHRLMDITAEIAVVFVALQSLKQLDDLGHLGAVQGGAAEGVAGEMDEIGLGGGQGAERLAADVQDIAGVGAGGHGTVEGIFTDEIKGSALQGIDLVVDENIARACQREQDLKMIVKMQSAHAPGLILVQLEIEFNICHRMTSINLCKKSKIRKGVVKNGRNLQKTEEIFMNCKGFRLN